MTPTVEVLHVPDCPNLGPLLERLRTVTDATVVTREIRTDSGARALGMTGSPTLLVDGRDPFAVDGSAEPGLTCRLYRDEQGRTVPVPSVAQLRTALVESVAVDAVVRPVERLTAWRRRARVHVPAERAMHQAILRAFVETGRAPRPAELDPVGGDSGRSTMDLLWALHDVDAVRLTPDGQIALAYPFSATPTRHRVHIDPADSAGGVDVYAMCAVDALGIAAMVGRSTVIESVDPTSGTTISVAMPAPGSGTEPVWDPPTAAVVVAVDPDGGPSADCCCDLINVVADVARAREWLMAHPDTQGQVLAPSDAVDLGRQLFGPLLSDEPTA